MAKHKVRIALAIDTEGDWNATGWGNVRKLPMADTELMNVACDTIGTGESRYFVEVEIEMPEVKVIEAEAKPA